MIIVQNYPEFCFCIEGDPHCREGKICEARYDLLYRLGERDEIR